MSSTTPGWIDIHTHILPGVDDGPETFDDTVALLHAIHATGVRTVVATPHRFVPVFDPSAQRLRDRFAETVEKLTELIQAPEHAHLGELDLRLGSENLVSPSFLDALEHDDLITLDGSRALLIEFPLDFPPSAIQRAVERVAKSGLTPVLAHVERYSAIRRRPTMLESLTDLGAVPLINGEACLGSMFSTVRRMVFKLLKQNLIGAITSDSHDTVRRPPNLDTTATALTKTFSEAQVTTWLKETPAFLLASTKP